MYIYTYTYVYIIWMNERYDVLTWMDIEVFPIKTPFFGGFSSAKNPLGVGPGRPVPSPMEAMQAGQIASFSLEWFVRFFFLSHNTS